MQERTTSITLTLEQRKMILQLVNYSYIIPSEYHKCLADAIKQYATRPLSDETIQKMVEKSQSVANSGFLLRDDSVSLFRGKFAEWLACIEYNAIKNSGSVIMTIINPDETSKTDLLHFIKMGDEFKAVAGPDIKSGGSTYVFNQWKKIVTSRYDIPMVDFDGVLTTEEGLKQLTKSQREEFEQLCIKYPKKHPIPSAWTNQDELRLRTDYFKSVLNDEDSFKYTPEISQLLKNALVNQANEQLQESDWSEFNRKCKEIFNDVDFRTENNVNGNFDSEKKSENERVRSSKTKPKDTKLKGIKYKTVIKVAKPLARIGAGAVMVGGVAAGAIIAVKNPELAKKVISGAVNIFQTSKPTIKTAEKTVKKTVNIIKDTPVKDPLKGIRTSPALHQVSEYLRKDGTKVSGYIRGKIK